MAQYCYLPSRRDNSYIAGYVTVVKTKRAKRQVSIFKLFHARS